MGEREDGLWEGGIREQELGTRRGCTQYPAPREKPQQNCIGLFPGAIRKGRCRVRTAAVGPLGLTMEIILPTGPRGRYFYATDNAAGDPSGKNGH